MNELTLPETSALLKQHAPMVEFVQDNLPRIVEQTNIYQKRQSQFMDNMLTVAQPTPIRRLRQILSEINRKVGAFREAKYGLRKNQIKKQMFLRDADKESDPLKADLLRLKAERCQSNIDGTLPVVAGAIRKVTALIEQHDSIMQSMGKFPGDVITEAEFEAQEEEYHIKTAFTQGLTAARARGGTIDEGNHIYLQQLGINGAAAACEVQRFLNREAIAFRNSEPTYGMVTDFLEEMYQKFKGCSSELAEHKGMLEKSEIALLELNHANTGI